jgi:signal transduction histidine kinase
MSRAGAVLIATVLIATALFYGILHQISSLWLDVALSPDVRQTLERSLADQKALRKLDPARQEDYRKQFDATQKLLNRMEVIRLNREAMLRRFELALVIVFALAAAIAAAAAYSRYRRAQLRERRQYLDRLEAWQQASRRHAHEIKGPLTALRLELDRFVEARGSPEASRIQESIQEELTRLTAYTREFSSFGALAAPVLREHSLRRLIDEFCETFAGAWPNLELLVAPSSSDATVCADGDMLRQVLVNLCANSAHAVDGRGVVTFVIRREGGHALLDVSDTGTGIPEELRRRIFDPYVTTRRIGEGMGLGLAISRKIMIDHGGDLSLMETSPTGATFRLTFGEQRCS